jgi:multidrug resistance efflux pump
LQRDQAANALKAAEAELELKRAGTWKPDRVVAHAAVDQAAASVERAKTELELLCAVAPIDSTILRVDVRVGEYVAGTPTEGLVILGLTEPLHIRVDVDEADIPRFHEGARAVAVLRGANADGIPLRFVRVEPFVQPKKWLSGAGSERVDTRVLQVIYALEDAKQVSAFVGQQVDVFIDAAN